MKGYASRLWAVNGRLKDIDGRLNSLYRQAGLLDIWNLICADFSISWSNRVNKAANYLSDTANELESVENEILTKIG
jgi:hypothetical protein